MDKNTAAVIYFKLGIGIVTVFLIQRHLPKLAKCANVEYLDLKPNRPHQI